MSDRFPRPQAWDRTHGPAWGAATDGLDQGAAYSAVVQSAIEDAMVSVTIPALHMSQTFRARVNPEAPLTKGMVCLVTFDEQRIPWVVTWT